MTSLRKTNTGTAQSELVTLRTFGDELEANLAKSRLLAAGIDCAFVRDDCGGMRPALSMSNGIRIVVRPDDASRAAEVLSEEPEK